MDDFLTWTTWIHDWCPNIYWIWHVQSRSCRSWHDVMPLENVKHGFLCLCFSWVNTCYGSVLISMPAFCEVGFSEENAWVLLQGLIVLLCSSALHMLFFLFFVQPPLFICWVKIAKCYFSWHFLVSFETCCHFWSKKE